MQSGQFNVKFMTHNSITGFIIVCHVHHEYIFLLQLKYTS